MFPRNAHVIVFSFLNNLVRKAMLAVMTSLKTRSVVLLQVEMFGMIVLTLATWLSAQPYPSEDYCMYCHGRNDKFYPYESMNLLCSP